jgi:hypothetical protein
VSGLATHLEDLTEPFSTDLVEHRGAQFVLVAEVRVHRALGVAGGVGDLFE